MQNNAILLSAVLFCTTMGRAQAPPLAGIAHMAFRVADLEKSLGFYRRLGFQQSFEITEEGKTAVSYVKINDRQFIELYARKENSQEIGLMHFCFEANDLAAVHGAFEREQLKPPEVKKGRAGNLLFAIHDLEGQVLEFTQYLPGSWHSLDRGKHLDAPRVSEHLLAGTAPVRDVAAESGFFITKLGFESVGSDGAHLRLPGNSGDEVDLEPAMLTAKPLMTFAVNDSKRAARNLRRRGFTVRTSREAVSITDPDGVRLVFQQARNEEDR
jgi:catechol 2,3-dioxygenase-like lactoylglutathione lyase family enzyme